MGTFLPHVSYSTDPGTQVSEASPGTYYILLECRHHLEDLTLALTIGEASYLR